MHGLMREGRGYPALYSTHCPPYGFELPEFTWEKTDKVDELRIKAGI